MNKECAYDELSNQLSIYLENRDYNRTIQSINLIINECQDPRIYTKLGLAFAGKIQYDKAIESFKHALRFNPDSTIANLNLGIIYYFKGHAEEAIKYYDKAKTLTPDWPVIYDYYVDVYDLIGEVELAHEAANNSSFANPLPYSDYKDLILVNYRFANYDKIIRDATTAIDDNPVNIDAYITLGLVYFRKPDFDKVILNFNKAAAINPNNEFFNYMMAISALFNDRTDFRVALDNIQKALLLNPKNPVYYFVLGKVYWGMGEVNNAITNLEKAVLIKPNYTFAFDSLSFIYRLTGQKEAAIAEYKKILSMQPDNPIVYFYLGDLYNWQQRYDLAIESLEKALEICPDYPQAKEKLKEARQNQEKFNPRPGI